MSFLYYISLYHELTIIIFFVAHSEMGHSAPIFLRPRHIDFVNSDVRSTCFDPKKPFALMKPLRFTELGKMAFDNNQMNAEGGAHRASAIPELRDEMKALIAKYKQALETALPEEKQSIMDEIKSCEELLKNTTWMLFALYDEGQ